jgi:hypothetical protein
MRDRSFMLRCFAGLPYRTCDGRDKTGKTAAFGREAPSSIANPHHRKFTKLTIATEPPVIGWAAANAHFG